MKRRQWVQDGQPALELIEEAFFWLRQIPVAVWIAYLVCMLPLLLGGLFFWAEMSRSPDAGRSLIPYSLILTGFFLLAKLGQSILCDCLQCRVGGLPASAWSVSRVLRTLGIHLAIQPPGLFLLPIGALLILPWGWLVAGFQNAVVLSALPGATVARVLRDAIRQSRAWPSQNHAILALLSLLGTFVFVNLLLLCAFAPQALKMFLGIETVFSRSPWSVLNSSVLATLLGFTLLALDPVFKAVYTVRCFQGLSVRSGQDLVAGLHLLRAGRASSILLGFLILFSGLGVRAETASEDPAPQRIPKARLDQAIDTTLARREYRWRLPEAAGDSSPVESTQGWTAFWKSISQHVSEMIEWASLWMAKLRGALERMFGSREAKPAEGGNFMLDWASPLAVLSKILIVLLAAGIGVLLFRLWRSRERPLVAGVPVAVAAPVDIENESVHASQLPEEGWLRLAEELAGSGDLRLAMRAFYLASLSHLAGRNLLSLAKAKSNRDYLNELRRRSHALPNVFALFSENVSEFERSWYGRHPVDPGYLERFAQRVRRLREEGA